MANLSAEKRIEKAHLAIMRDARFCAWAGLLFIGKVTIVNEPGPGGVKTAWVDAAGNVSYYRPFIDNLPSEGGVDSQVNFVVLHETGHKALMHLTRGKQLFLRNAKKANIAADHVVNNMIYEIDPAEKFAKCVRQPDGSYFGVGIDTQYKHMSLKEVYNKLEDDDCNGDGMDGHDPNGDDGPLTAEQEQVLHDAIEQALRTGNYLASKQGSGGAARAIMDALKPKIDWKDELREFVLETCQGDDDYSWMQPNRRFIGQDIYMPMAYSESIGALVATCDLSGSVGEAEFQACFTEILTLCRVVRPSKLILLYWDAAITGEEHYTPDQYDIMHTLTKPKGGGGTLVEPVAARVKELAKSEQIQAVVNMTDGYLGGSWGTWAVPVLWVMTTDVKPPMGKHLRIDIDD